MSQNSEPIRYEDPLLRLIDQGISEIRGPESRGSWKNRPKSA